LPLGGPNGRGRGILARLVHVGTHVSAVLGFHLLGELLIAVSQRRLRDPSTAWVWTSGSGHGRVFSDVKPEIIIAHLNIALPIGNADAVTKVEVKPQGRLARLPILTRATHIQLAEHVLLDWPGSGRISA